MTFVPQTMTSESCLLCGGQAFEPLFAAEKFPLVIGAVPADRKVPEHPLKIKACTDCALVQQVSRLAPEVVDGLYTADYYSCPSPVLTGMGAGEIDKFVAFFKACGLKAGEILEIACFDGYLLLKLKELGWSVWGCDPAAQAKIASEKLGADRVSREFFKEGTYKAGRFDAIVARNLLEHIYDLHGFLKAVAGSLEDGGHLLIEVPNVHTTLELGVFASFFHQHISYFSQATLSRLLFENGFTPVHWEVGPTLMVAARKGMQDQKLVAGFVSTSGMLREKILDVFNDSSVKTIALFGASAISTTIVSMLDVKGRAKLKAVFDNDSQKRGKRIYGSDVLIAPPTADAVKGIDALLIASNLFEKEIRAQLKSLGFSEEKIRPLFPR
jgi:2-polyprenyl-3-methyl-5-hydroxy-6-metoxy-1,4-benzoquinol methylase